MKAAASDARRSRPGRPRDGSVDARLLEAALAEMSARGFAGLSIHGVSVRTGIGKPAIYRRYADKTALAIAAIASLAVNEDPAAPEELDRALGRQLLLANHNLELNGGVVLLGALLAERDQRPEMIDLYRDRLLRPRLAKIRSILALARTAGMIDDEADLDMAALTLVGLLAASYVAGLAVTADAVDVAVRQLLAGLRPSVQAAMPAGENDGITSRAKKRSRSIPPHGSFSNT